MLYEVITNLAKIEWEVTVGKKDDTTELRTQETETRSIEYSYTSAETFTEAAAMKDGVIDYETPYVLSSVKDQMGFYTAYNYEEGLASFTFDKYRAHSENVYMLLTEIIENYTEADGNYKNKRCFEYEQP